jgi:MFS family permease
MSPMIQEEGISAPHAAFAVSAYAVGQIFGRILTGVALDNFPPRRVAFFFIFVPASGFLLLWGANDNFTVALIAATLIGIQHGAEIDIFAFFVARRFGMHRYGSVYGAVLSMGWIGNALGIVGFGRLHDIAGSYDLPELIAAFSLAIGAILIAGVSLPPRRHEG